MTEVKEYKTWPLDHPRLDDNHQPGLDIITNMNLIKDIGET